MCSSTNQHLSEVGYWWVIYDIEVVDRRVRRRSTASFGIGHRFAAGDHWSGTSWRLVFERVRAAVQACLGSIVYRAGEVHAVGNFANTSHCQLASVLVMRDYPLVTMNHEEHLVRVVGSGWVI